MATYTQRVCLDITVGNSTFTIFEGSEIGGLTYTQSGVTTTACGKVRVINVNTSTNTVVQGCPPESYFVTVADCPSFVFDTSDSFNAKLDLVYINNITAIDYVKNDDETQNSNEIPIVDETSDLNEDEVYTNMLVFDRIEGVN